MTTLRTQAAPQFWPAHVQGAPFGGQAPRRAKAKGPKMAEDQGPWWTQAKPPEGPKVEESLRFRAKRAALGVLCNLNAPFLRRHTFQDGAPAEVKQRLQAGDILLRRTDFTSGNFFIPSWWKHAAVYTGQGQIMEAAFKGLHSVSVDEFFQKGDDVMIVRLKDVSREQQRAIAAYAKAQVGKPYDFDVDFLDPQRMSCTELAFQSLKAGTGRDPVGMGSLGEVTGDRFMNPNFDLVYTSNRKQSGFPG